MTREALIVIYLAAAIACITGFSVPLIAADFYEGKTIRINVGSPPGGGFDTYARLIARHLPKHIPGKPSMIVQNMPGGGGLIAANYLYNVSRPDGLTIGHILWTVPQMEYLGISAVKYKSLDFEWLGLANSSVITVAIRKDAPVQSVEEWINPKTVPLVFGCVSRGTLTCSLALALNNVFGPISKIVPGYGGTAPVRAAMLRKEVDALTGWTWDSVKSTGLPMIEAGDLKLLAYIGEERHPELEERKVPYLNKYVRKAEDQAFLKLLMMPSAMVRPWAAVPGTPKERVTILRQAFTDTMKDPAFHKEAKRLKVDIAPKSADWLEGFIRKTKNDLKPEVVDRARKVLGLK